MEKFEKMDFFLVEVRGPDWREQQGGWNCLSNFIWKWKWKGKKCEDGNEIFKNDLLMEEEKPQYDGSPMYYEACTYEGLPIFN